MNRFLVVLQVIQALTLAYLWYRTRMLKEKLRTLTLTQLGMMGAMGYQMLGKAIAMHPETPQAIPDLDPRPKC